MKIHYTKHKKTNILGNLHHVISKLSQTILFYKKLDKRKRIYVQLAVGAILIIFIPLAIMTLSRPQKAEAGWFDDNWAYRKAVDITSATALTDFQVSFTLDTTDQTRVQADCDDIRITDANGKLLPYWVEAGNPGCDNAATKIWVKVPSVYTTGTTLYVYYGNPSAQAYQNGDDAFEFFDDFERGNMNKWTSIGTWAVNSTAFAGTYSGYASGSPQYLQKTGFTYNTATVEMEARFNETNKWHYPLYNDQYILVAKNDGHWGYYTGAAYSNLPTDTTYSADTWYKIVLYLNQAGDSYTVYIDGVNKGTITNNAGFNAAAQFTKVAPLNTASGDTGGMRIDNIFLRQYAATDPTTALGSEVQGTAPVGYWKFDEGYGVKASSSVWKKAGTVTNQMANPSFEVNDTDGGWYDTGTNPPTSTRITTDKVYGIAAEQLTFAGTNSVFAVNKIADKALISGIPFTLTAWVKAAAGVTDARLMMQANYSTSRYSAYYSGSGEWEKMTLTATSTMDVGGTTTYIVFGVYSGTNALVAYIDGVQLEYNSSAGKTYCDGSVLGNGSHAWAGTAHNSLSTCDYGNDGEIITGATWQTEDMCVSEKCLSFDGTNDYVRVPASSTLDPTSSITISTWVNANNITSQTVPPIVKKAGATSGYALEINHLDSKVRLWLYISGGWISSNGYLLSTNKWYHITGVYDGSNIKLYIDGAQAVSPVSQTGDFTASTEDLAIGWDTINTTRFFNGRIDDVKIYPYARSADQIKLDYNSGKAGQGVSKGSGVAIGKKSDQWLKNGLVGYWKMDEASWAGTAGEVIDSSGTGNNGTRAGGATTATGKYGNAGIFDGTGDYVDAGSASSLQITGDITVSAWVKDTINDGASRGIVEKMKYSLTSYAGYGITKQSNYFKFWTASGGSTTYTQSDTTYTDTNWHLITGIRRNGVNYLYIDGIQQSTSQSPPFSDSGESLVIGRYYSDVDNYYWIGSIDEARVYNRAFSPQEVSDLYNWAPGPITEWKLDEGSGSIGNDTSGNGKNLANDLGSSTITTGKFGKARNFDNTTGQTMKTTSTMSDTLNAMTVGAWVNLHETSVAGRDIQTFVAGLHSVTATPFYFSTSYQGGNMMVHRGSWGSNGKAWSCSNAACALPLNQWAYITMTIPDSTTVNFYVNGQLVQTVSPAQTTWGAGSIGTIADSYHIGGTNGWASTYFDGQIDQVKIYNYARTEKQIVEDMNAGHPAVGSPVGTALGYWKFNEGANDTCSGGSNDSCNSGSAGTTLDGAITGAAWTNSGKFGKALSFNTTHYVTYGSSASTLNINDAITISSWVNFSSLNGGSNNYLVHKNTYRTALHGSAGANPATFGIYIVGSGGTAWYNTTDTITPNVYHHLVAVYDSSQVKLYLDGILSKTFANTTGTINSSAANNLLIGGDSASGLIGSLDEVKIYNYALTADEVKVDMNQGKSLVLGAISDTSGLTGGLIGSSSASAEYCVPGDTTSCAAPVGEWKMDQGSGNTVFDTSGNGYNGTNSGNTIVTGKYGKGWKGVLGNNYINVGSKAGLQFNYTSDFTFGSWVKVDALPAGSTYPFVLIQEASSGRFCYSIQVVQSTGNLLVAVGKRGTADYYVDLGTPTVSQWYYVVGVYTGQNLYTYLNGRYVGTVAWGGGAVSAANGNMTFLTDSYDYDVRNFTGSVDNIRIYNYARTQAQIAWEYNRGKPLGYYKFDECQGSTAYDASGNANNGTITIGATGDQSTLGTCTTPTDGTGAWYNGRNGKYNSSLSLDGTNASDYVLVADSTASRTTVDWTRMLWVKSPTVAGGDGSNRDIWTQRSTTNKFLLRVDTTGNWTVYYYATGAAFNALSPVARTPNEWTHLTIVKSGTNITLYLNGIAKATASDALNFPNDSHALYFGSSAGLTQNFLGHIDDARVYNYALTPAQIKEAMNEGSAVRFGPNTGTP